MLLALAVKFMLSPYENLKAAIGGLLAGGVIAYYGSDPVLRWIDGLTVDDRNLVVIALAFTGEHIARWLIRLTPEGALKMWRGKGSGK